MIRQASCSAADAGSGLESDLEFEVGRGPSSDCQRSTHSPSARGFCVHLPPSLAERKRQSNIRESGGIFAPFP